MKAYTLHGRIRSGGLRSRCRARSGAGRRRGAADAVDMWGLFVGGSASVVEEDERGRGARSGGGDGRAVPVFFVFRRGTFAGAGFDHQGVRIVARDSASAGAGFGERGLLVPSSWRASDVSEDCSGG